MTDLGFLNIIQSLQRTESPRSVHEMVQAAEEAFAATSLHTLEAFFLSIMNHMEASMSAGDGNYLKILEDHSIEAK